MAEKKGKTEQNVQFKMYLPPDVDTSLREAAQKIDGTPQDVVKELISDYLSFWEQAEAVRRRKLEDQLESYLRTLKATEVDEVDLSRLRLGNEFTEALAQKLSQVLAKNKEGRKRGKR